MHFAPLQFFFFDVFFFGGMSTTAKILTINGMADLAFYYQDTSVYTPLTTHNTDVNELDERLDTLEVASSQLQSEISAQEALINSIISRIGDVTSDDMSKILDWVAPVIDFTGDFADELLRYWLDQVSVKDWLKEFLTNQVIPPVGGEGEDDQNITQPDVPVDFRALSKNPFAVDRTNGMLNQDFGVTVDRDFNLLSTSTINVLDPGALTTGGPFGAAYSMIMTNAAKYEIANLSNMSLRMNTGTFDQQISTALLSASNAIIAGRQVLTSRSNAEVSTLSIIDEAEDPLLGISTTASILTDGSAKFHSLNVNDNLIVRPNGDVLLNGQLVMTGSGRHIVADEDVIPSSSRAKLSDIQAGNLGKPDIHGFDKEINQYSSTDKTDPLAFIGVDNRGEIITALHPEMSTSIAGSMSEAASRAQSICGIGDFQRIFSVSEDEMFDIDISTGQVIGATVAPPVVTIQAPAPLIVEATAAPSRSDSFADVFVEPVNAPLHMLNFNIFQKPDGPFFGVVNQFTAQDNAWSIEIEQEVQNLPWALALNDSFSKLAMRDHIGLTNADVYVGIGTQADPTNILDDGLDDYWQV